MITSQEARRGDGGESLCVIPLKEKSEELNKDDKFCYWQIIGTGLLFFKMFQNLKLHILVEMTEYC